MRYKDEQQLKENISPDVTYQDGDDYTWDDDEEVVEKRKLRRDMRGRYNKWNNTKVEIDGILFDSKRESQVYLELKALQEKGEIRDLKCHPTFQLQPPFRDWSGKKQQAISYTPDFHYFDKFGNQHVVEVKNPVNVKDAAYRVKARMFMWQWPAVIYEVIL